ncbi:hypothetical protein DUNSADRAFT_4921 [Dunaliella salina]|uniref:Uncharacterized protein n=1 Tax=Dunaliella salina TaxID=3046 RepID=A0ABQ7GQZ6_DUNSA|nr:hypothetical protein DUNSADRAFT_4921 [Dunaliella salina]|eukprot:KAF5837041.1 hypothetical protein DUNSADRAFT_4921 [Dunaliella salina]
MNSSSSLPGSHSTLACFCSSGNWMSRAVCFHRSGGSSTREPKARNKNHPLLGTGWVSVEQAQADKRKHSCRVFGTSGRDVNVSTQDFRPGRQARAPLTKSLEWIPQQQQQQHGKEELQQQQGEDQPWQLLSQQQVPMEEEQLQDTAHEVFGKNFRELTLRERQSVSRILSSRQGQAQGGQRKANASPKSDVEAEREAAAQELFGKSWSKLMTREKQSLAAKLIHRKQHAGSKRAQARAIQQQKDSLALAHFGKPFSELGLREKHMLGRLWNKESISKQGRAAVLPPGKSSKEHEEQLQQQRLQYLEQQRQQQQERREHEALWQQERNALSRQQYGKDWEELPEKAKHSVRALMRHRHQRQDHLAAGLKAWDAAKAQQLQAIAAERLGKDYDALSPEEKRSVVQIWRWCNPLEMLGSQEEVQEQPQVNARDSYLQHQQQAMEGDEREREHQQQQQRQQQQQQQQEKEELAVDVYGQPWESLALGERRTILAHMRHARRHDKNGTAVDDDGRNWLEMVKDRIRQALTEQQELQRRRESVAMQWFGKAWDSLTPSEKASASARMGRLDSRTQTSRQMPEPPSDPGAERKREVLAQLFYGTTWDELSNQQRRSIAARLPLATPDYIQHQQEKVQRQRAKEAEAERMYGQAWRDLSDSQRKSVAAYVAWAASKGHKVPLGQQRAVPGATRAPVLDASRTPVQDIARPPSTTTTTTTTTSNTAGTGSGALEHVPQMPHGLPHVPQAPEPTPAAAVARGGRGRPRKAAIPDAPSTAPITAINTANTDGTGSDALEHVPQMSQAPHVPRAPPGPAPAAGVASKGRGRPRKSPASSTMPPASTSVPADAAPATPDFNGDVSTNLGSSIPADSQDSELTPGPAASVSTDSQGPDLTPDPAVAVSPAQDSEPMPNPATDGSPRARRARTPRTKPAPAADDVPTRMAGIPSTTAGAPSTTAGAQTTIAGTPEMHGTAIIPPKPSTPPSTSEAQTPDPAAAPARKRSRASPTTPSPPPQRTTAAAGGARRRRSKGDQGADERKDVEDGADSPSTPQPANIPAMLQRLKDIQGLGARIRQVRDRLEGSRAQYERLPPQRANEKQRYFDSLKGAQASLDEVARLENQILTGIQQREQQEGQG